MSRWRQKLDYASRLAGTVLCLIALGLACTLVSALVFPLIHLTSPDKDATRRRVRLFLHQSYRFFIGMARMLGVISYELHGREKLAVPGQLLVANHPSLIDMLFIGAQIPQLDCIVKDALLRNPFLRAVVRWADYIPNSAPERLIENCAVTLRAGHSLVVFPEGTRSSPGQPLKMKRGAAHIALASGCDLLPVTILCQPSSLTKTDVWYRLPQHRPHWSISVGEPIRLAMLVLPGEPESRAARRVTAYLIEYFSARTGRAVPQSVPASPLVAHIAVISTVASR